MGQALRASGPVARGDCGQESQPRPGCQCQRRKSAFGEHLADAATDSYDRDWAMGMLSCEQSALYEIEAALDRLSRGTYGRCELTGGPIEPDRLRAIPWTRFCAAAQKELEEKGDLGRRQMGELRNYYDVDDSREPSDEEPEAPQTVTEQKAGRSTSPVGTPVLIER